MWYQKWWEIRKRCARSGQINNWRLVVSEPSCVRKARIWTVKHLVATLTGRYSSQNGNGREIEKRMFIVHSAYPFENWPWCRSRISGSILFPPLPPSPSEIRDVHTDEIKSSCICPPLSGWKPRSNHYYILCTQCCPRKRGMSSLYIVTRSYCTSGIKGAHSLEFFLPCVDKRDANLAVLL